MARYLINLLTVFTLLFASGCMSTTTKNIKTEAENLCGEQEVTTVFLNNFHEGNGWELFDLFCGEKDADAVDFYQLDAIIKNCGNTGTAIYLGFQINSNNCG